MEKQNKDSTGHRRTKDRFCITCNILFNGFRTRCRSCYNKKQRFDWSDPNNPKKKHQLSKRYGCSPQEYVDRMKSSAGCMICNKNTELCYDHCHTTMKFRGVLCRSCNKAIGQLGDTADSLKKAYEYLLVHETKKEINGNNR